MPRKLRVHVVACAHGNKDLKSGRSSLTEAVKDAEKQGFDVGFYAGDWSGSQSLPTEKEGRNFYDQLDAGLVNHHPEEYYVAGGNHDRTDQAGRECGDFVQRYLDPYCEHPETSRRRIEHQPYPINRGPGWEAYEVPIGGISFIVLSDVNRPETPLRGEGSGDPGGVVLPDTLAWWEGKAAEYEITGQSLITISHYLPKETTTATTEYGGGILRSDGTYEGRFHAEGRDNGRTSSYLAYIGEEIGRPFIEYLERNPGQCQMWIGGHNHIRSGVKIGDLPHINELQGCLFVQSGAATMYHHKLKSHRNPKSRIYEFEHGSSEVKIEALMHASVNGFNRGLFSTKAFQLSKPVELY